MPAHLFPNGDTKCQPVCCDCALVCGTDSLAAACGGDQSRLAPLSRLVLAVAPVLCAPTRCDARGSRRGTGALLLCSCRGVGSTGRHLCACRNSYPGAGE